MQVGKKTDRKTLRSVTFKSIIEITYRRDKINR